MDLKKSKGLIGMLAVTLAAIAASSYFYRQLPDRLAAHWDATGQVNGYMSKAAGAFFIPLLLAVFSLLYWLLPKIDPKKPNIEAFRKDYDRLWLALAAFFFYLHALIIDWNLGYRIDFIRMLAPAFALLWYVIGMSIERATPNWFVGIRTPWTLSDDEVWRKTHLLGGRIFKATALVILVFALFVPKVALVFVAASACFDAVVTVVYSYLAYHDAHPPVQSQRPS